MNSVASETPYAEDNNEKRKREGDDAYMDSKRVPAEKNREQLYEYLKDEVDVPKAKVGILIGSKGVIINEIMRRSGS